MLQGMRLNNMSAAEILAPAGDIETLYAAVRCGANAVYIGLKELNARRNAGNFTNEELPGIVGYCHARNVKVYLTLNTLVSDRELFKADEIIKTACRADVDALIIQDLGLIPLIKSTAPDMRLHASTQMSVNTADGINELERLGFDRTVLPREMSKSEIKSIIKNSKLQTEVFVHGALCMCVSGQCYMSAMLGQRSGNRGLCAQPCRLPFSADGKNGCDLSLRDLSLVDYIGELQLLGISSLKIEGRMKRPEYVAAAVSACRQALEGKTLTQTKEALRSVFSRSGFTAGYYENKLGSEMFGVRQKEDVIAAKTVLPELQRLYDKENPLVPIDFALTVVRGEPITLSGRAGRAMFFAQSDIIPANALNTPVTAEGLEKQLSKLGGVPFFIGSADIELDEGLNIPVSAVNALRRSVTAELLKKLETVSPKKYEDKEIVISPHITAKNAVFARFSSVNQVPDNLDGIELIYLPLFSDMQRLRQIKSRIKVGLEIPRCIFGNEQRVKKALKEARENGFDICLANTLDGVRLGRQEGFELHSGHTLNLFNSYALDFAQSLGITKAAISAEMTLSQIQRLGGSIQRGMVSYGRLPLMITRNCPVANVKKCGQCKSGASLTDRLGVEFPVRCSGGFSEIFNSRPIYLADRLCELKNIDYQILYFTIEKASECEKIIKAYIKGAVPRGEFTRGLYYRGVE